MNYEGKEVNDEYALFSLSYFTVLYSEQVPE
jgi:hypothetical protein